MKFSCDIKNPFLATELGWLAALYRSAYDFESLSDPKWHKGKHKFKKLLVQGLFSLPWIRSNSVLTVIGKTSSYDVLINDRNSQFHSVTFGRFQRCYEPEVFFALMALLKPHGTMQPVFWDVGANWGHFAIAIWAKYGSSVRVEAFEPQQNACQDFRSIVEQLYGPKTISLHEFALGADAGKAFVGLKSGFHSGVAEVRRKRQFAWQPCSIERADCIPVDTIPWPTVVKIDVEGMEADVLEGMRAITTMSHCAVIYEHFLSGDKRHNPLLPELLENQGYLNLILKYNVEAMVSGGASTSSGPGPESHLFEFECVELASILPEMGLSKVNVLAVHNRELTSVLDALRSCKLI